MTHTSYAFVLLEAGDLMWLWTLLGVIGLFVLGVVAYNARTRSRFPRESVDPREGRIMRRSGGKKPKGKRPYD